MKSKGVGLRHLFCDTLKDEIWMMMLGLSGGSLYFLFENTALVYTQASNVSIILTATPLLTMIASAIFFPKKNSVRPKAFLYSAIALAGVAAVVLNGNLVLKLHPMGDILTLCASACWVIYTFILLKFDGKYSTTMITRKVFLYGVLTMLPIFLLKPWQTSLQTLANGAVWGNLLFLGGIASFACFYIWNEALKKIGGVKANNYLYINPLATSIFAVPILHERLTWISILGAVLIIGGMYLASKHSK